MLSTEQGPSTDIDFHLQAACNAFYANLRVLCDKTVSLQHRLRYFDAVASPVACYAAGHRKKFREDLRKLDVTFRRLLRCVVGGDLHLLGIHLKQQCRNCTAGLEPGSVRWLPALDGGKLHLQLQTMVEAEEQRLERLAEQRREALARLQFQERQRDLAVSDALLAAEGAGAAAQRAGEARRTAERAACLAIAEEVSCLAESLQICVLNDEPEDATLEDVSDRCLVAAERTKATAWGPELRRLSGELAGSTSRLAPQGTLPALAEASAQLAAVATGLRQEPGVGVSLPSTEPPPPPQGPMTATPATYAQLLRQVDQLQGALAREKLISSSLKAEIEATRALRGTGLLIS
ncbi:unnamed protein product [Symbiodinium natans]|uniref:Uncharacterized protein n=1 Tax=Symbiodinium natans TaxID=878477 RepID=A0A812ML61_9DINO|nr:unnamed protein product [Symbiodinium natans]